VVTALDLSEMFCAETGEFRERHLAELSVTPRLMDHTAECNLLGRRRFSICRRHLD
jgi:hypothetical protein